jgi:hypothetical protein
VSLLPPPPGVTVVAEPAVLTAASLALTGFHYDGVVDLPTSTGTLRVLRFSMDEAISTGFTLDVTKAGHTFRTATSTLTLTGHVIFFCTSLAGSFPGGSLIFTPDSPPLAAHAGAAADRGAGRRGPRHERRGKRARLHARLPGVGSPSAGGGSR